MLVVSKQEHRQKIQEKVEKRMMVPMKYRHIRSVCLMVPFMTGGGNGLQVI